MHKLPLLYSILGEIQIINVGTLGIQRKRILLLSIVSIKNQVAGREDVVEDGGAEVERGREGQEGLEGP